MSLEKRIKRMSNRYMELGVGRNKAQIRAEEQEHPPALQDLILRLEWKEDLIRRQTGYLVYGMAFDVLEMEALREREP